MKRLSLLVFFFYCCSFVNPPQSRAVIPLAVLAPAAIGAAVVAIAGTQYALKGDHSGGSYHFDGHNLTVPLVAFKKFASAGGELLLGRSVTAVLDAKRAFDDNVLQGYSALKGLMDDYFGSSDVTIPEIDDIFSPESSGIENSSQCVGGKVTYRGSLNLCYAEPQTNFCSNRTYTYFVVREDTSGCPYPYTRIQVSVTPTEESENWPPPSLPENLPPQDVPGLSDKFAQAAPINPDVKNDLDQLLKDYPEYWPFAGTATPIPNPEGIEDYPPAQPITAPDVQQWAQGQSAGAQQNYIDTLQDLVDSNPTDTGLASELARAQAEQVQQQAEDIEEQADTYNPITDNPFGEAYNPGAFDIPSRFTTFLNNVKSTGLFSFSSAYFNSIPGGGSPTYTVEAGTYGTHTIDLSETMGTGLAVLKTVLLLLFGFLSIRVVILKR